MFTCCLRKILIFFLPKTTVVSLVVVGGKEDREVGARAHPERERESAKEAAANQHHRTTEV